MGQGSTWKTSNCPMLQWPHFSGHMYDRPIHISGVMGPHFQGGPSDMYGAVKAQGSRILGPGSPTQTKTLRQLKCLPYRGRCRPTLDNSAACLPVWMRILFASSSSKVAKMMKRRANGVVGTTNVEQLPILSRGSGHLAAASCKVGYLMNINVAGVAAAPDINKIGEQCCL